MPIEIALHIDRESERTIHHQLLEQLRQAILDGRLEGGSQIPSSRALSDQLGVSRNTVLAAYGDLYAEGYIEGRHGSGTYVVEGLLEVPQQVGTCERRESRWLRKPALEKPPDLSTPDPRASVVFELGQPSLDPVPERLWRKLWREVETNMPPAGYGPPGGYLELRRAIAAYLGRSRGIVCTPDQVVITAGSLQAVDLIGRALLQPGDLIGYENPGYMRSLQNLKLTGARIAPVRVTEDGLDIDDLEQLPEPPILVYTTPSHQYPTGARLPVSSRLALLDWAGRNDALIVEDDYDSELRFDGPPLPALAGLDHEGRTVYIGTFSKMLSPALRVGYIVGPMPLVERLTDYKRVIDFQTSWPVQFMLARFVESGQLERHIRRMRRHYAAKRQLLGEILGDLGERATLRGLEAGLHAFLEVFEPLRADDIASQALAEGVQVATIEPYYIGPADRQGILLGYGGLTMEQIERGATVLAGIIRRA